MAAKRVLIVEDQREVAESLRICLELAGFDTKTAYSGPDGLALALEWLPDFVLCDIGLPGGLDGWELATKLRQTACTKQSRLIAISAYGSDQDLARSREAGFERHLTKPVDPAILVELLGST
jgi:CheY-like chemotaxis protein